MTGQERIIETIRKLKALSTSSNEHEAASAAAFAQKLLQQHKLTMADVELASSADEEEISSSDRINLAGYKMRRDEYRWKVLLFWGIARYNFCTAVHHDTGWSNETKARHQMTLIGKESDREVVLFLYDVISRQLEEWSRKLPKRALMAEAIFADRSKYNVWGPRKSFLYAAVNEVKQRLYEGQHRWAASDSKALVLVRTSEVALSQKMDEMFPKLSHSKFENPLIIPDAYGMEEGKKAGQRVQFQKGIGGKQVGTKAIGSGS